jgi:hypothetical protein
MFAEAAANPLRNGPFEWLVEKSGRPCPANKYIVYEKQDNEKGKSKQYWQWY